MAKGFDSEKLTLHIGDGFEFLKNHINEFDVPLIYYTDSSSYIANPTQKFLKTFKPIYVFGNELLGVDSSCDCLFFFLDNYHRG